MHIALAPKHEAFRNNVKRFLDQSLTKELRSSARLSTGMLQDYETSIRWQRILYQQGWAAPAWPKEYGGPGWDAIQRYVWDQECAEAGAPALAPMGLGMCGPMLIGCGTEQQRQELLPRILSGHDYWCQGYSEPSSGSDLASLSLRAEEDRNHFILNGAKVWTTHAQYANKMFLLARTSKATKPQDGITFLLVDMDTHGITVEPIIFSSGIHEVNQVVFENVRVPMGNMVGEKDRGWTVAKYLLEFERGGGSSGAASKAALNRVAELAKDVPDDDGKTVYENYDFQRRYNEIAVSVEALTWTEHRVMAATSNGDRPGPESSVLKLLAAKTSQAITELGIEALGQYQLVYQPEALPIGSNVAGIGPDTGLAMFSTYLNTRAISIAGGTDEVQKNIIAKQVLGL